MVSQSVPEQVLELEEKVRSGGLPEDLANRVLIRLERLSKMEGFPAIFDELDRVADYVGWLIRLPWNKRSEDILDLDHTKQILDKNHYGLNDIKERVLEFAAVMKLNRDKSSSARAPILCFTGLVGTGKTTIAYSVAEALGKKFARIAFGGMEDPLDLRGQSKVHPEAEPGQIVKNLAKVGVKNPVILLDEIDRVTDEGRASIMGVLVELLDPEQNSAFLDHFVDYPVDLSEALFITTANNTANIATAVLDRLEVIQMPAYTDEEKIVIAKSYMFPRVLEESGLPKDGVVIDDALWPTIVRPLGYDAGMRTLERTIEGVVRKVAREVVEGKTDKVHLNEENVKEYLTSY